MPPAVSREVLRLAAPAIGTSLLNTLVFVADRLMLARFDRAALASMQLQGPLMWSVASVFMALGVGTVALVARATGAGDLERARRIARAALRLALALGLLTAFGGLLGLDVLVRALGPDDLELQALSRDYLRVGMAMLPLEFVATAAAMIHHGHGDTRTPFVVGIVANLANVGANAILIFGADLGGLRVPPLGTEGAALGTALAFALETVLLVGNLARRRHPLSIGPLRVLASRREHEESTRALVKLGVPAVIERLVVHAGFLAFAKAVTTLGELPMATNQAMVTIESICFLCADGFGVAAATVMGQRLGAGDVEGARRGGSAATGMAVTTITGLGLVIWATAAFTLPVFAPDPATGPALVAAGQDVMPILVLSQPFMSCSIVVAQGLRGAGDTRSPVVAAIGGGLFVRVGLAYGLTMGLDLGLSGIWWASMGDWIVRTAILLVVFARGRWTRLRL